MSTSDDQSFQVLSSHITKEQSFPLLKPSLGKTQLPSWMGGIKSPIVNAHHSRTASRDAYDYFFKILVIGPAMSGKSSIIRQFCSRQFIEEHQATFGMQNHLNTLHFGDKAIKISLWDSPSDENFSHQIHTHVSSADAVVYVYNSMDEKSVFQTQSLIEEFNTDISSKVTLFAISNKRDLKKKGSSLFTLSSEILQKHNIKAFSVSARSYRQVDEAFEQILEVLIEKQNKILQRQLSYCDSERAPKSQSMDSPRDKLGELMGKDDEDEVETQVPRKKTDISYASNFGITNYSFQLNQQPLGDLEEKLLSPREIKLKSPKVAMENEDNMEQRSITESRYLISEKPESIPKKTPNCETGCKIF